MNDDDMLLVCAGCGEESEESELYNCEECGNEVCPCCEIYDEKEEKTYCQRCADLLGIA
jgi:hypothetical protein